MRELHCCIYRLSIDYQHSFYINIFFRIFWYLSISPSLSLYLWTICSYGRIFTDKFISFTNEWVHFIVCCYRYRSLCMQSQYLLSNDYGGDCKKIERMHLVDINLCIGDLNNKKKRASRIIFLCMWMLRMENKYAVEHIGLNQILFIIISCLLLF